MKPGLLRRGVSHNFEITVRFEKYIKGGANQVKDNIQEMYANARIAFKKVEYWPQDEVDVMVQAVASLRANWHDHSASADSGSRRDDQ